MNFLYLLLLLQAFQCSKNGFSPLSQHITDVIINKTDLPNFKEQQKGIDLSIPIQAKQGTVKRSYVYAAVNNEDKEKLPYIVERIDSDIANKRCYDPDVLNALDPSSHKTPLARAVETNNKKTIQTLLSSPNINIALVDNRQRTFLHIAAIKNKREAFLAIWNHIKNQQPKNAVDYLFKVDSKGHSVFASCYLSDTSFGLFSRTNLQFQMFQFILENVKDSLNKADLEKIKDEIVQLSDNKVIKRKYAEQLQNALGISNEKRKLKED